MEDNINIRVAVNVNITGNNEKKKHFRSQLDSFSYVYNVPEDATIVEHFVMWKALVSALGHNTDKYMLFSLADDHVCEEIHNT
jgi:hypothetical protein